jgi:hypothetical protein
MSMRLGIGLGLPHVSRAGGTAAWAPDGSFDYYVDGIAGSDGNDGSAPEQAWATFAPLRTAVFNLTTGQTRTAVIRATTHTDQHLSLTNNASPRAEITITFEEGTALVWESESSPGNGVAAGGTLKVTANGNGCTITGYSPNSGNGLGANNTGYLVAHDFVVDDADDGVSAHSSSRIDVHDCVFRNCSKAAFAIVDSGIFNAYGCTFEGRLNATLSIGSYLNSSSGELEDCIFTPASQGQTLRLSQGGAVTATRCRFGTLDTHLTLVSDNAVSTITDSFLNMNLDGTVQAALEGCYGRLTTRQRSGGDISISHCVLVGGASGLANSVLFRNFNGGQDDWNVIDSVLTGYGTAVGHNFGATDAGYFETAGNTVTYCCLHGNSVNIDADIVATSADVSTGVITTDPEIGPADSYVRNDYAVAAGSPCVGAGSDGGDIGFQAAA